MLDFVRIKALVQFLSKILWSFVFSFSWFQYLWMNFINKHFQKTYFCKRAVLCWQIWAQPDIQFLLIWSVSLDVYIILNVTYSVCFEFVLKEEFEIQRTGTWQRWKGESASQSCSRTQPGHCLRDMCLLESKERDYISQIGGILDATAGKN